MVQMSRRHRISYLLSVMTLGLGAWPIAVGCDKKPPIEAGQKWSCVFDNTDIVLDFRLRSLQRFEGKVLWQLNTIEKRTIARGELAVDADSAKRGAFKLRLKIPNVKPGVILPVVLGVQLQDAANTKGVATYEKTMWIFPQTPFSDRSQWLKDLKIVLFDPDGTTGAVLKKIDIPFEETRNPAALTELSGGIVIVGEGVSFDDYRDLGEALVKAAVKGTSVLCLAPSAGVVPIPGIGGAPAPATLSLANDEIIRKIDKRFDRASWGAEASPIVSRLSLRVDQGQIVGESHGKEGWPWMEAYFAGPKSRLVFCGFGIIRHWDANPTPRFLLASLLELLEVKSHGAQEKER